MNILITGANGQLGNHMRLLESELQHRCFFTDVEELDITRREEVFNFVLHNDVQLIINCAAYTNVDKAEDEEEVADRINNDAVRYLADVMKAVGGRLIHVSTDYVFGGGQHNRPCLEDLPACPTGAYGRTKLRGEQAIAEVGCRHVIIRTGWLYSEYGKNFVKTMLKVLSERPVCKVVFDQIGTPTYAGDLARAICSIVNSDGLGSIDGIFNFSDEGVCSWYDFAVEIARQAGITGCEVLPCHSDEFPSKVIRPSYSVLDKTKIKETFGLTIPHWTVSLKRCLAGIKNGVE